MWQHIKSAKDKEEKSSAEKQGWGSAHPDYEYRKNLNRLKGVAESAENSKSNCENNFNMDDIYQYVEFDKPLYSVVAKRKTAQLVYMSPREYLQKIAKNFKMSYKDTIASPNVDASMVRKYATEMKRGDKFPPIYYNKDSNMQEGRHRALAAMLNGCTEIPVIEFRRIGDNEFKSFVLKVKDLSLEKINDIFAKYYYFRPVTKLGYGDLQRYMQYNIK